MNNETTNTVKVYSTEEIAQLINQANAEQLGKCVLYLAMGQVQAAVDGKFGFKHNSGLFQMASWVSMNRVLSGKFIEMARARCLENIEFMTHVINSKKQKQEINYSLYRRPEWKLSSSDTINSATADDLE